MGKPFWMTLKIEDEGICHAPALRPFDSDKIVAIDRRHRFERKGIGLGNFLPAGIFYMSSKALTEKTDGKTTHVRYNDIYDLGRSLGHTASGEAAEAELMDISRTEMRATADLICISRGMNEEERAELQDRLIAQRGGFRKPKRLPGKLRAGEHLLTAARLHAEGNQRNAPAARCTHVAATYVEKRLKTLDSMHRYFGQLELKVWRVIREQRAIVERAWIVFAKAPTSSGGGSPERSIPGIQKMLPRFIADFNGMRLRPYRDLAKLIAIHLRWLDFELAERDMPAVGKRIEEIMRALRSLRMIEYLETEFIGPLAFYLDRPRAKREDPINFREDYLTQTAKALKRIHSLTEAEIPSRVLFIVRSELALALTELEKDKPRFAAAKDCLKTASIVLATVSAFPRAPYPFMQEMADAS